MSDHLVNPELGTHAKPFGGQRGSRVGIALGDFDALCSAALRLSNGTVRDLTGVSVEEMRALFALAAVGGMTVQLTADAIEASDNAKSKHTITARLDELFEFVRPLMEQHHDH